MRKTAKSNGSRKVMSVIVLALLLVVLLATFASAAWTDRFSGLGDKFSGLSSSKWIVILVNGALLGLIGYLALLLILKKIDENKNVIIAGIVVFALLIAKQMFDSNIKDFLWKIPEVSDFLHIRVLANLVVVAGILYLLYTLLLKPEKEQSAPFEVMIIGLILLLSVNAVQPVLKYDDKTYHYIWEWESIVPYRFMLLGDEGCTYYEFEGDYFQKDGKWYYDDWVFDNDITNPVLVAELERVKGIREKNKDVASRDEISDLEEKRIFDLTKGKPLTTVVAKTRLDKYCYTQKNIDDFLEAKNKNEAYVAKEKQPTAEEISATGGFGILRGMHLIMLILGVIILSWTAQVWEIIKTENKNLTYLLAFIFSVMIAKSSVSMQGFARIMQIFLLLALFKMFGGDYKNLKAPGTWFAIAASLITVSSIISTVNPSYLIPGIGFFFTIGNIYSYFPSPLAFAFSIVEIILVVLYMFKGPLPKSGWWRFGIGCGAFVLLQFIPGVNSYAMRGKTLGFVLLICLGVGLLIIIAMGILGSGEKSHFLTRGYAIINNRIRDIITESWPYRKFMQIRQWMTGEEMRIIPEVDVPGLLPYYVHQNLPLFYHLFNLCKRTWIYYAYWNVVKSLWKVDTDKGKTKSKVEMIRDGIGRHGDLKKLRRDIINYRSSPSNWSESPFHYDMTGKAVKDKTKDAAKSFFSGWCSHHKKIAQVYNQTLEEASQALIALEISDERGFEYHLSIVENLTRDIEAIKKDIAQAYNGSVEESDKNANERGFLGRLDAYSWHSVLRTSMTYALGMANSAYLYDHTYVFADPDAELKDGGKAGKLNQNSYWEVNLDGTFIDDVNDNVKSWNDERQVYEEDFDQHRTDTNPAKKPRKLKDPRKVLTYTNNLAGHDFEQILRWMDIDWDFWLKDMRYGLFHQKSRSWFDYQREYSQLNLHDNHITKGSRISEGNPSFDLRLLSNPGHWQYWGRKNYYDVAEKECYDENPFPWISLKGISEYLKYEFKKRIPDEHHRIQVAEMFPAVDNIERPDELIGTLADSLRKAGKA